MYLTRSKSKELIQETPECIICYSNCETQKESLNLPIRCECKYYVHNYCFNEWTIKNNGISKCIICRKSFPVVTVITAGFLYVDNTEHFRTEIEERIDNFQQPFYAMRAMNLIAAGLVVIYLTLFLFELSRMILGK